jgi:hypothetical protein
MRSLVEMQLTRLTLAAALLSAACADDADSMPVFGRVRALQVGGVSARGYGGGLLFGSMLLAPRQSGTCDAGYTYCGNGCMPVGDTCCGTSGYCPAANVCTSDSGCCPVSCFCEMETMVRRT